VAGIQAQISTLSLLSQTRNYGELLEAGDLNCFLALVSDHTSAAVLLLATVLLRTSNSTDVCWCAVDALKRTADEVKQLERQIRPAGQLQVRSARQRRCLQLSN
jgi:hypothetical protein